MVSFLREGQGHKGFCRVTGEPYGQQVTLRTKTQCSAWPDCLWNLDESFSAGFLRVFWFLKDQGVICWSFQKPAGSWVLLVLIFRNEVSALMGFSASPGLCRSEGGANLEMTALPGLSLEGRREADFPPSRSSAVWVLSITHSKATRGIAAPQSQEEALQGWGGSHRWWLGLGDVMVAVPVHR